MHGTNETANESIVILHRLLTLPEAAHYLGCTIWSVRELIWRGQLPYTRFGKRFQVDRQDLDELVDREKRCEGTGPATRRVKQGARGIANVLHADVAQNRNLSLLRRMMNLARREGKSVQFPYFPMLKESNVRKGFLTPAQFTKLRDAMPEHLRPLMTFLYFTGCRIGAALAITWSQIEFENGRFQLRIEGNQTKNEEPLLLPLPLELNEVLEKTPHEGRLFDARNLRKSFHAACGKVGVGVKSVPEDWEYKGLLIHDFRRSGVRNLIRSGVPRRIAMKISGHLTESTFERYNIVDSTDLHEAMAKVEKHFGKIDGKLMAVDGKQARTGP